MSTSVVIAPGGAYVGTADDVEGTPYARWLCAHGIASYILHYRLGGTGLVLVSGGGFGQSSAAAAAAAASCSCTHPLTHTHPFQLLCARPRGRHYAGYANRTPPVERLEQGPFTLDCRLHLPFCSSASSYLLHTAQSICRSQVGVIGSSAGGHLVATVLAYHDAGNRTAGDYIERFRCG